MKQTEFEFFLMFLQNIKKNADTTFANTGSFRAKLISEHATIALEHAVLFKSDMKIKKAKTIKIKYDQN